MAREVVSAEFDCSAKTQVCRADIGDASRIWITLAGKLWSDGVLLVQVRPPGIGTPHDLIRIPAAGIAGPLNVVMAEEIVVSLETADTTETQAAVSVIAE